MKKNPAVTQKQFELFDLEKKMEKSTSTLVEIRLPFFAPVGKIPGNSKTALEFKKNSGILVRETAWGKIEIRGRKILTQTHKDILDCLFTYNQKIIKNIDGTVDIYFSQTKILTMYGFDYDGANKNIKWLKLKLQEIEDCTYNLEQTGKGHRSFGIITHNDFSEEYGMYRIRLDSRYVEYYEQEWSMNYQKELPNLLKVKNDTVKCIVRWFFTHTSKCTYGLDKVLGAIGYPVESPKSYRNVIASLKAGVEEMQMFGLDYRIKEKMFYYEGNDNIRHYQGKIDFDKNKKSAINSSPHIGEMLLIDNKDAKITAISYEKNENDTIKECVIATSIDSYKIPNVENKEQKEFYEDVEYWIKSNLK